MSQFRVDNLKLLQHRFRQKEKGDGEGLTLMEFVDIMLRVIPMEADADEHDLV
jgi:hypothetical protein